MSAENVINPPRETDEKGRVIVRQLTDREIAEETLTMMRLVSDVLNAIGENPMMSKMIPGLAASKRAAENGRKV